MKPLKSLLLFALPLILIASCFDAPEFPNTPRIDFKGLYFRDLPSGPDSLVLTISFQDGDGNLGLSENETQNPYNENNFFIDTSGKIASVRSSQFVDDNNTPQAVPPFTFPHNCINFLYDKIRVEESQKNLIDKTFNITDTIVSNGIRYYEVLDTFYIQKNRNHYNIEISFWLLKSGGNPASDNDYTQFDWETIYPYPTCGESFNGRFPLLGTEGKQNPLEGNLTYAMKSSGFNPILGNKTFKLKVRIRDRALNESNLIETPPTTLDKIRK